MDAYLDRMFAEVKASSDAIKHNVICYYYFNISRCQRCPIMSCRDNPNKEVKDA